MPMSYELAFAKLFAATGFDATAYSNLCVLAVFMAAIHSQRPPAVFMIGAIRHAPPNVNR